MWSYREVKQTYKNPVIHLHAPQCPFLAFTWVNVEIKSNVCITEEHLALAKV